MPLIVGANSYEGTLLKGGGLIPALRPRMPAVRKLYETEASGDAQLMAAKVSALTNFVAPASFLARAMETAKQLAWLYRFSYIT